MFEKVKKHHALALSTLVILLSLISMPPAGAVRPAQHDFTYTLEADSQELAVTNSEEAFEQWLNPLGRKWDEVAPYSVQLVGQRFTSPEGGGSTGDLQVKTIKTSSGMVFHLSWKDDSCDEGSSESTPPDMAAVEFPIKPNSDSALAMGHANSPVNILVWRATGANLPEKTKKRWLSNRGAKRVSINAEFTEMVAEGMFNRHPKEPTLQALQGASVWERGYWNVTLFKPFNSSDPQNPDFSTEYIPVAFAVWNGSSGEASSKKSISAWAKLLLKP